MAASPKEKFDAAVRVIQSLPKNASAVKPGAFMPSHTMMLRFYAYFKQANNGPCTSSRPAFWDVIGKAKWDAWNRLGDMSREEAMIKYVDELKKVLTETYPNGYDHEEIVEAMPHTAMVQDFVQKLDNFYELVDSKETTPKLNGSIPNGAGDHANGTGEHSGTDDELAPGSPEGQGQRPQEEVIAAGLATKKPIGQGMGDTSEENETEEEVTSQNSEPVIAKPFKQDKNSLNAGPLNGNDAVEFTLEPQSYSSASSPTHQRMSAQDSDSEADEFCDTSDSPQSQRQGLEDIDQTYVDSGDHTYHREAANQYQPPTINFPHSGSSASPYSFSHRSSSSFLSPAQAMSDFMSPAQMIDRSQSTMFTQQSYLDFTDRDWTRAQGKSARGAGEGQPGATSRVPQVPSSGGVASHQSGSGTFAQATGGRSQLLTAGGAGGGGGDDPPQYRPEVTQQIAMALVQLQQDMNSVLTRLNTLEALTVAQSQISRRSRENSGSSQSGASWWPFSNTQNTTWFFIFIWPFFVHWLITFISRRRNRREL